MKKFSEQLHKKSLTVSLTKDEKSDLKQRLTAYMEYHPLPNSTVVSKTKSERIKSESFVTLPFSYFARIAGAAAVLLLVLIPAMAERAVPGEGLYAIKVRFNEEVRSTLALSSYEKIEWETERLNRRIAEARLLAGEGRLTEEVENEVAAAVKTHTENAKREIALLRNEDQEEADLATIELSTTLEVQAASLQDRNTDELAVTTFAATGPAPKKSILASAVAAAEEAVESEGVSAGVPSFDRLMARVEANTTRIYELLRTLDLPETSTDYIDISRRIDDINRTQAAAPEKRESEEEAARLELVDALQRTQRLIVFMTEIRTDKEYQVDDFVPVVLTPEETENKLNEFEIETKELIEEIRKERASSSNSQANEKSANSLEELLKLEAELASTTDVKVATPLYASITALAEDTIALFDQPEELPPLIDRATSSPEIATTTIQNETTE